MKKINNWEKSATEIILFTTAFVLCFLVFYRQIVFSGFDLLPGNAGDSRFNNIILEHWYQLVRGNVALFSPNFFYPIKGVLGYSDTNFLFAIPYVITRLLGIDMFSSSQIALFVFVVLGWTGTVIFLRTLGLNRVASLIGAILFAFPNAMANAIANGHTQLYAVYVVPWIALGLYVFVRNYRRNLRKERISGIFLATIIPLLLFSSFYIAWYVVLFCLIFAISYLVVIPFLVGKELTIKQLKRFLFELRWISPYLLFGLVVLIPFFITYIPVWWQFGGRSYFLGVELYMPSLTDYINVGPGNYVWGKMLYENVTYLSARYQDYELMKGTPIGAFLVFLGGLYYFSKRLIYLQGNFFPETSIYDLRDDSVSDENPKLVFYSVVLGLAILLTWLLMLKVQRISLWIFILKLFPGGGGIRAVFRFQHVLAFPLAIMISILVHRSWLWAMKIALPKRAICFLAVSLILGFLVLEQYNYRNLAAYSKKQQWEILSRVKTPPQQARVFCLAPGSGQAEGQYENQIDAMLIASQFNLFTINGYSGQFPKGWDGIRDVNGPLYFASVEKWIHQNKIDPESFYFVDIEGGKWVALRDMRSFQTFLQDQSL